MPVSTSIAISSQTTSIIALQQALEAKRIACESIVDTYKGGGSVEMQKQFADCINLLHPDAMTSSDVVWLKITIVVAFIGLIAGVVFSVRESWNGLFEHFCFGFIGLLAAPAVLWALIVLFAVANFLFS